MLIYELIKYNLLTLGNGGGFLNIGYKVTLNPNAKKIQHLFKILSYGKVKSKMSDVETLYILKAQVWREFKASPGKPNHVLLMALPTEDWSPVLKEQNVKYDLKNCRLRAYTKRSSFKLAKGSRKGPSGGQFWKMG